VGARDIIAAIAVWNQMPAIGEDAISLDGRRNRVER
jgi:hypothetical protein